MISPIMAIMRDLRSDLPVTLLKTIKPKPLKRNIQEGQRPMLPLPVAEPGRPIRIFRLSPQWRSQWQRWPKRGLPFLFVPFYNHRYRWWPKLSHQEHWGGWSGRASIHCSVIDSCKHDNGRSGIETEGCRDQEGDSCDRSDSRSTPMTVPTMQPIRQ